MKRLIYFLSLISLISCGITSNKKSNSEEITIKWVDNLPGDFSFKDNWSYPEGVYQNEFGQLSCDGICPQEIYNMMDKNGRIYQDSLESYYQLVDTTHLFHSIESNAWCYEWGGTDYITAQRINKDTVVCFTENNATTHSSLNLIITKNTVKPTIILNSISDSDIKIYKCKRGQMVIDEKLWNQGILKATFDFDFYHDEDSNRMYWKGNIYVKIENNKQTNNRTTSDSLFAENLIEHQLVTSRYGRFLPDGSYVDELKDKEFDIYYISIPNDYSIDVVRGEDFYVYYIQPADTTVQAPFEAGVYFGNFPNEFKPDSCNVKTQKSEILGKKTKWTIFNCDGRYHIQTIIDSESRWNQDSFIHAFGNADSAEGLSKLFDIFRTMRKENDYRQYVNKQVKT